jgi:hypothetical protein
MESEREFGEIGIVRGNWERDRDREFGEEKR